MFTNAEIQFLRDINFPPLKFTNETNFHFVNRKRQWSSLEPRSPFHRALQVLSIDHTRSEYQILSRARGNKEHYHQYWPAA